MYKEDFNLHDKIVSAMTKIFSAYGYDVLYDVKGKRYKVQGNSGIHYRPDIVPKKGSISIICDVRTSGQRGTSKEIDRGAIQLLQAELDDMRNMLKIPKGLIINPYGIREGAKSLAEHFGIDVIILPVESVEKINSLDLISEKSLILKEAQRNGIFL